MKCIILGNGNSRLGFDYREEYPGAFVIGCNGAFKESPDALVCNDVKMQHIIYKSGYCENNLCLFSQWEPLPGYIGMLLAEQLGNPVVSNEKDDRTSCVVSGTKDTTYMTWTKADCVTSIPEIPMSSGSRALLYACESGQFDEIIMIGFDGVGAKNLYQDDEGYEDSFPLGEWVKERQEIMKKFESQVDFKCPDIDNHLCQMGEI